MLGPPHPAPGEVAGGAPFLGGRCSQLPQVYFIIIILFLSWIVFLVGMPLLLSHVETVVDKCSEIHPSKVMERWSQARLKARVSQCFRFLAKHNIS